MSRNRHGTMAPQLFRRLRNTFEHNSDANLLMRVCVSEAGRHFGGLHAFRFSTTHRAPSDTIQHICPIIRRPVRCVRGHISSGGKAQCPAQLMQCTTTNRIELDLSKYTLVLRANTSTGYVPYGMNCSMNSLNLHLEIMITSCQTSSSRPAAAQAGCHDIFSSAIPSLHTAYLSTSASARMPCKNCWISAMNRLSVSCQLTKRSLAWKGTL